MKKIALCQFLQYTGKYGGNLNNMVPNTIDQWFVVCYVGFRELPCEMIPLWTLYLNIRNVSLTYGIGCPRISESFKLKGAFVPGVFQKHLRVGENLSPSLGAV